MPAGGCSPPRASECTTSPCAAAIFKEKHIPDPSLYDFPSIMAAVLPKSVTRLIV